MILAIDHFRNGCNRNARQSGDIFNRYDSPHSYIKTMIFSFFMISTSENLLLKPFRRYCNQTASFCKQFFPELQPNLRNPKQNYPFHGSFRCGTAHLSRDLCKTLPPFARDNKLRGGAVTAFICSRDALFLRTGIVKRRTVEIIIEPKIRYSPSCDTDTSLIK